MNKTITPEELAEAVEILTGQELESITDIRLSQGLIEVKCLKPNPEYIPELGGPTWQWAKDGTGYPIIELHRIGIRR